MASPQLKWVLETMSADAARAGITPLRFDVLAARAALPPTQLPMPENIRETWIEFARFRAVWVAPRACKSAQRILYFHGGGYVCGDYQSHRALVAWLAATTGLAILFPEYRRAPEDRCPAFLQDGDMSYDHIWRYGPDGAERAADSVMLAGDSAGGGLAIATALRGQKRGAMALDGIILLSPMLNFDERTSEFLRASARAREMVRQCVTDPSDLRSPNMSPANANAEDLSSLPPILIQAGSSDYMLNDSVQFAQRLKAVGVPVQFDIWPDMPHVWHRFAPKLPEALDALRQVATYVQALQSR